MMEKFKKFNEMLSDWAEWVGFFAVFIMVVITPFVCIHINRCVFFCIIIPFH